MLAWVRQCGQVQQCGIWEEIDMGGLAWDGTLGWYRWAGRYLEPSVEIWNLSGFKGTGLGLGGSSRAPRDLRRH